MCSMDGMTEILCAVSTRLLPLEDEIFGCLPPAGRCQVYDERYKAACGTVYSSLVGCFAGVCLMGINTIS